METFAFRAMNTDILLAAQGTLDKIEKGFAANSAIHPGK